jgi:hypothetical protein
MNNKSKKDLEGSIARGHAIDVIQQEQGWSDTTLFNLARDFLIANKESGEAFIAHLRSVQIHENEMAGE